MGHTGELDGEGPRGQGRRAAGALRAFLALPLPEALEARVVELVHRERPRAPEARWLKAGAFHLTLRFLGALAEERVAPLAEALTAATQALAPFELTLKGTGSFGRARRPRVLWLGVGGGLEPLGALQRAVETALVPFGFLPEERPFHPHLTLARARLPAGDSALADVAARHAGLELGRFGVDALVLFKSELGAEGARHTPVARVPLLARP